jgi:membrane protein implicated in regulation of membrane protease activity
MTVYEYAPLFEKKKEKILSGALICLAAALYIGAQIPSAPLPWLFQILAVACLSVVILLTSLCLLRRYVYRIEQKDDGELDFIIDEYTGRRKTTVCRISAASVVSVDDSAATVVSSVIPSVFSADISSVSTPVCALSWQVVLES